MSQKILSDAAGREVQRGEFVWARLNRVSLPDSSHFARWIAFFDRNGLEVWDPDRIDIAFDHLYRGSGSGSGSLPLIRSWARRQGIPWQSVYDIGRHGLSHQVPAEHGKVLPGTMFVAADTQGPTMGALNAFAVACLDAVPYIMATGETWLRVPDAIRIVFRGALPSDVRGKDIYLRLLKDLRGAAQGRVIEFAGPGLASMPMDVRMGVSNGAPHLGAVTAIFPPDAVLERFVRARTDAPFQGAEPDDDADYAATHEYDLSGFEPLVAGPDDPEVIRSLSELEGSRIDAAYIGSCSSGRFDDLELAARVLSGRHVDPAVRLVVTPISSKVMQQAADCGLLAVFARAGATITTPGCGACFYGNQSPLLLDDGEVCITGSVENWPGRMGSASAKIFLGNAAVVAAAALHGRIASPARYLETPAVGGSVR